MRKMKLSQPKLGDIPPSISLRSADGARVELSEVPRPAAIVFMRNLA